MLCAQLHMHAVRVVRDGAVIPEYDDGMTG